MVEFLENPKEFKNYCLRAHDIYNKIFSKQIMDTKWDNLLNKI